MYFEYDTPVWSLTMIWSTPSSRYFHVVAKSAFGGGIPLLASIEVMVVNMDVKEEVLGGRVARWWW